MGSGDRRGEWGERTADCDGITPTPAGVVTPDGERETTLNGWPMVSSAVCLGSTLVPKGAATTGSWASERVASWAVEACHVKRQMAFHSSTLAFLVLVVFAGLVEGSVIRWSRSTIGAGNDGITWRRNACSAF